MKRAKLKGALVLLGVFALGALAGGAGIRAWTQREYTDELAGPPGRRFERRHLRAFARELELTDEQRAKIHDIMRKHRPEREQLMKHLAEECGEELKAHKAKADAEIRTVLGPEQQKRFDALQEKQRERFPFFGPPHGRPHERPKPEHVFRRFDDDGDGELRENDVPARMWRRLKRADSNGDGIVTLDELKAHRRTGPPP